MPIIGLGIDHVSVARVTQLLTEHGDHAFDRIFTPAEQAYCNQSKLRFEHFAGRFAAKEAILKALGTGWRGGIAWTDMEILPDTAGKPHLALGGYTADLARKMNITHWHISLTHTAEYASAVAVAERV